MKKSVLLVDDDAGVVRATRRLIASLYVVETASSVGDAFELIRGGQRFDAIVCDYHLGDSNASELVRLLCVLDAHQGARVLVYSGVSPAERDRLGKLGMTVLPKPSRREELVEAIERASAGRPKRS